MRLETVTTECAMYKLARFLGSSPAEKVAYVRRRSKLLDGTNPSLIADETILDNLVVVEDRMRQFVQHFEQVQSAITPGLVLEDYVVSMINEFVNVAVVAGIESILQALEPVDTVSPLPDSELITAIDTLFESRDYLRERLELMYSLIKNPELVSEVIYTDFNTCNRVFVPLTDGEGKNSDDLYGLAFLWFMGVDLCMLINEACMIANSAYTPKVSGFSHEFYLYIVLHELSHLWVEADDLAYHFTADQEAKDFDVYSMANLKASDMNNADNYCTLIFIALAKLHKQGFIDLRRY